MTGVQTCALPIWQHAHFTAAELGQALVSGADADPDNDDMRNHAEYIAGTRPKDARSRLHIGSTELDATGGRDRKSEG